MEKKLNYKQIYFPEIHFSKDDDINFITFQITDQCNLKCSYCYEINKTKNIMPFFIARIFIDNLLTKNTNIYEYLNIYNSKGIIFHFIGGEPLLYPDLIDNIITYYIDTINKLNHPFKNIPFKVGISTNGTLYFSEKVQKLLNKWNNLIELGITLDGDKELHDSCRKFPNGEGSYDLVINAINDYYKKRHKLPSNKITLSPINISFLYQGFINLINLQYTYLKIEPILEEGWNNFHAAIFYQQLKKIANYLLDNDLENEIYITLFSNQQSHFYPNPLLNKPCKWCQSDEKKHQFLVLDYNGDLYSCIRFTESSIMKSKAIPPLILGNIFEGINNNSYYYNCIHKIITTPREERYPLECLTCQIGSHCLECFGYNYSKNKDVLITTQQDKCIMYKAQSLANAYFWNLYYHKHNENTRFKIWLPDEEALKIISKEELDMLKSLQYPIK